MVYVFGSLLPITINLSYIFKHDSKEISNTAAEQLNVSVCGAEKVQTFFTVSLSGFKTGTAPKLHRTKMLLHLNRKTNFRLKS